MTTLYHEFQIIFKNSNTSPSTCQSTPRISRSEINYFIVSDNNCQSTPISIHSSFLINSQS